MRGFEPGLLGNKGTAQPPRPILFSLLNIFSPTVNYKLW